MPSRRVSKNTSHRAHRARQRLIRTTVHELIGPTIQITGSTDVGIDLPARPQIGTVITIPMNKNIGKVVVPTGWKVVFYADRIEYTYR